MRLPRLPKAVKQNRRKLLREYRHWRECLAVAQLSKDASLAAFRRAIAAARVRYAHTGKTWGERKLGVARYHGWAGAREAEQKFEEAKRAYQDRLADLESKLIRAKAAAIAVGVRRDYYGEGLLDDGPR